MLAKYENFPHLIYIRKHEIQYVIYIHSGIRSLPAES